MSDTKILFPDASKLQMVAPSSGAGWGEEREASEQPPQSGLRSAGESASASVVPFELGAAAGSNQVRFERPHSSMLSSAGRTMLSFSPAQELYDAAAAMRATGQNFASLMSGEAIRPVEPRARAAAASSAGSEARHAARAGHPALRAALSRMLRERGYDFCDKEVLVTESARVGTYFAMLAMNVGTPFVIPAPFAWSHIHHCQLAGGIPSPLFATRGGGQKVTPLALADALGPGGGVLVLSHPGTSSGVLYTRDELKAIGDVLLATRSSCIVDESSAGLVYEAPFSSLLHVVPELRNRSVVVSELSKRFPMDGHRLGVLCGNADVMAAIERVQSSLGMAASSVAQHAALGALATPVAEMRIWWERHLAARDHACDVLRKEGIRCAKPAAGRYLFPDVQEFYGFNSQSGVLVSSSVSLASYLLREHRVLVAPGSAFGDDDRIRISFSVEPEELERGLKRLVFGLHALRGKTSRQNDLTRPM